MHFVDRSISSASPGCDPEHEQRLRQTCGLFIWRIKILDGLILVEGKPVLSNRSKKSMQESISIESNSSL